MQATYPYVLYRIEVSRVTNKPLLILIDSSTMKHRLLTKLDTLKASNPANHYAVVEVKLEVLAEYIPIGSQVDASKTAELPSITATDDDAPNTTSG